MAPFMHRLLGRLRAGLGGMARPASDASDVDTGPLIDEESLRQIERLSLASLQAHTAGLMGEHAGRRRTQAIEFADYRGYAPGDDLRLIDWNAYARLGELFVKTSQSPENVTLSLLVDCSRSMDWGRPNKLRYAKRVAAALGAIALLRYDTVRLYGLGDGTAIPGAVLRGQGALAALLEELEAMPVAATTQLRDSIAAFNSAAGHRGIVVLVSDLLAPSNQTSALGDLADPAVDAIVLHLVDTREVAPVVGGALELRDRETGEIVPLTVTPGLRRRYAARFEEWSRDLAAQCAAQGVRYARAVTLQPPVALVAGALQEVELLRA